MRRPGRLGGHANGAAYNRAMTPALAPILDLAELRDFEARHQDAGLMERAGAAAAEVVARLCGDRGRPIVVLAGPGNNGGDAFVAARLLRSTYHDVHVVFAGDPQRMPKDAAAALQHLIEHGATPNEDVQDVGGNIKVASVKDPFGNIFGVIENPNFKL